MKYLTLLFTLITFSASAQLEAYHLYKVVYTGTGVTVPNKTGTARYYLESNIGTFNAVADLDGNGVVNAGDITTYLGDAVLMWNEAQYNCGLKFSQYQCFALWIQDNGGVVGAWSQIEPDIVRVQTINPNAFWYWFDL